MLVENAPGVLIFYFEDQLTQADQDELANLKSQSELSDTDVARKKQLEQKRYTTTQHVPAIPIPVDTKVTPFFSAGLTNKATKTIDMYQNYPILNAVDNSVTLNFSSPKGLFVNALLFSLDYMFRADGLIPSIQYFSDEAIILNGYISGYTHNIDTTTNKHMIKIELQKVAKTFENNKKTTEITKTSLT